MTNKYFTTLIFDSSPKEIYDFYTDVANWNAWDTELEYSELKQPFANNSEGFLRPKGSPEIKFTLQNVQQDIGFDQITNLPFGSKFVLTRRIKLLENGSEVTHSGYFEGIFGAIIGFFLKIKYTPLLKKSVIKLKELCQNQPKKQNN